MVDGGSSGQRVSTTGTKKHYRTGVAALSMLTSILPSISALIFWRRLTVLEIWGEIDQRGR